MDPGAFCGSADFFKRSVDAAVANVMLNRIVEERSILRYDADGLS